MQKQMIPDVAFGSETGYAADLLQYSLEQAPYGILVADVATKRFVAANATICRLLGYSRQELLSLTVRDIHPPVAHFELLPVFERHAAGEQSKLLNVPCQRKDGTIIYVNIRATPYTLSDQPLLIGYFEEVSAPQCLGHKAEEEVHIYREIARAMDLNCLVSVTDERGLILSANARFCAVSGYSEQELVGRPHKIVNSGYHPPEFWREFWSTIGSGKDWYGEIKNRKKDGEYYWVESYVRPVANSEGKITHFLSISHEITALKDTENRLRLAEEKMRGILESQSTYVVRIDLQGNYTYANPKFLRDFYLQKEEEILGKSALSTVMPYNHEQLTATVQGCLANPGKVYQLELDKKRADGTICTALWDFVALTDSNGNPNEIQCAGIDYTQKRQAERELQLTRKRLEETSELARVGGWEIELATGKVYWSSVTRQILGVSPEYQPDLDTAAAFMKSGVSRQVFRQAMERAMLTGEPADVELELITADGREIWVRSILRAERQQGHTSRLYGMFQDITERKQFEREILVAREAAERASKAKSEFLANMSHEIRTPLNAVIGFTELLKEAKVDQLYQEYIHNANVSAKILLEVISDILDFSKIEAGKLELDEIECDLYELVSHAADIVKFPASQKGLELLLKIAPDVPRFVVLDPMRVRQVLINLLSNAVKFTERGEVELEILFEELSPDKGRFTFIVRDTGLGMTEEQKARLFKAFSQGDASISRRYGGTGLGLVICEGLLQKMESHLYLQSTPGVGSTFTFSLERQYRHGEAIPREQIAHFQHVLVVDDNASNREILRLILERWGMPVSLAGSGDQALVLLEQHPEIDLLITDYQMPAMNGLELIARIHQLRKAPELPAIILLHSSASDAIIFKRKRELCIDLTMAKPVTTDAMLRALHFLAEGKAGTATREPFENLPAVKDIRKKILVVEDVEMNLILIRSMLLRLYPDCEVIEARNGLIAIKRFLEQQPHLVLMDIHMPEMDGITTTRYLRQLIEERQPVPVIALTAATTREEVTSCLAVGMQEVLAKPVKLTELKQLLQKYFSA